MAMVMQQLERCIHMAYYHRQLLTEQPFAGVAVGHNSPRRGSLCLTGQNAHEATSVNWCIIHKMVSSKTVLCSKLLCIHDTC